MTERWVLLGAAAPRRPWFRELSRWSTAAVLPCEFLKCVSLDELRARLATGRPCSAVLLDAGLPGLDRDLLAQAREAGVAVVVVDERAGARDWLGLGATAVLPAPFSRDDLLDVLALHARPVGRPPLDVPLPVGTDDATVRRRGVVVAVCGAGGTGASTVATALAQGLASSAARDQVVLADLCRHAQQALLHDVRDVAPGVQELVEAHRGRRPDSAEVRALTFDVVDRGYRLLLGLRRARYWSALPPRALDAALESLVTTFGAVVADVDADLEGEAEGGSADVEERNAMARGAVARADVVVAVGGPGVKGLHSLVRVLDDLASFGVAPARVLPVVNQAPRPPRARAELARTLADLAAEGSAERPSPVFLPRRRVEEAQRDGVRLPAPLPDTVAAAVEAVLARAATGAVGATPTATALRPAEPELVVPGSLGTWTEEDL